MSIHSRRSRDPRDLTSNRAVSSPAVSSRLGLVFSLCAGALLTLAPQAASAQGRLDAHYEATLSGVPVGKGAWTIEIGDDTFSAAAQGGTAGLLKAFSGGTGSGASQGRVVGGALVANAYTATTTTQKKAETIRMVLANGNVKDLSIDPVPPVDPNRIVVTDAHRKGVLDPMTGSMLRVPGNARCCRRRPAVRLPGFSTAGCATISSSIQAHGDGQGREGLSRPGRGLRGLFTPARAISPTAP